MDRYLDNLSEYAKDLVKKGIDIERRILPGDLADDRWYVDFVNGALAQAEQTESIVNDMTIPRGNVDLLTRMVAESNRSLNDETSAGSFSFLKKKLFYYSFDYLPFPHELETNCFIDTISNKLVLPGTEKDIVFSIEAVGMTDTSANYEQNGNTIEATNMYMSSSTLSFTLEPQGKCNVVQFQVITEGTTGSVTSVKDSDGLELLTSQIELSGMRIVRLYVPETDEQVNVQIELKPKKAGNSRCLVRNVFMRKRQYNTSGTIELGMEASGDISVTTGFTGEGSVSVSIITDGTYESTVNVYSGRAVTFSCNESFRLMFTIQTEENNTPMFSYLSVLSKAGIANVL